MQKSAASLCESMDLSPQEIHFYHGLKKLKLTADFLSGFFFFIISGQCKTEPIGVKVCCKVVLSVKGLAKSRFLQSHFGQNDL